MREVEVRFGIVVAKTSNLRYYKRKVKMAVFFPLILFFTAVLSKPNKSDPLIPLTG